MGHQLRRAGARPRAHHPRPAPAHPARPPARRQPYYKIQIGTLERLPHPIPSRAWRRITFLYTTGQRLLAAEELNDLIVQSEERDRLWKALYERGLSAERQYESASGGELDLALLCALGQLGITLR